MILIVWEEFMKRAAILSLLMLAAIPSASAEEEAVFRGAGTFTCVNLQANT